MKAIQNYSINVKVLEEFNREVTKQGRSAVVEAMMIRFMVDFSIEIPTLFGKNGKYYCPKCKTEHHHGDGSVEGHRVAHCGDIKNYPRGYYVKEV